MHFSGNTNETRGTAYVVYEDIFDAKNACDHLSGFNVCNRYLIVLYYQPNKVSPLSKIAGKGKTNCPLKVLKCPTFLIALNMCKILDTVIKLPHLKNLCCRYVAPFYVICQTIFHYLILVSLLLIKACLQTLKSPTRTLTYSASF